MVRLSGAHLCGQFCTLDCLGWLGVGSFPQSPPKQVRPRRVSRDRRPSAAKGSEVLQLKDLVVRAQCGEVDAYEALVRHFQSMAVSYAHSVLGDHHLAEDAAQEAFVQAYLRLGQLAQPTAFATWLRRIVYKHCDRIARRKQLPTIAQEAVDSVPATCSDAASQLEATDAAAELRRVIEALPDAEREVVKAYYLAAMSQREVADFVGIPVTMVNYRLHAARRRLKEELTKMPDPARLEHSDADNRIADRVGDELRTLEHLHGRLAGDLQSIFSVAMGREAVVEVSEVKKPSYREFIGALPRHSCTYYFNMEPMKGWVTWNLSIPLALASLHRFQDGETLAQEAEDRQFLPTDKVGVGNHNLGLLSQLIRLIARTLEHSWEPVLPVRVSNIEIETTPKLLLKDARLTSPDETVVQVDMEAQLPGFSGLVANMCYPAAMLNEALLSEG
ncbi:sigma-70 family RNA polymerase sigma factor [Candidatus Latescibacterota bacterium]